MRFAIYTKGFVYGCFCTTDLAKEWAEKNLTNGEWELVQFICPENV